MIALPRYYILLFFLMTPPPPRSTLFPYTTLFRSRLTLALALASAQQPPARETLAWIRWQLGEVAFSMGDYTKAEQHYRGALTTFSDYYRALASLGRALAAKGDLSNAIANYERAIQVIPDPSFVAALGDLYKVMGRDHEAAAQV